MQSNSIQTCAHQVCYQAIRTTLPLPVWIWQQFVLMAELHRRERAGWVLWRWGQRGVKIITPAGRYASQGRFMSLGQSAVKESYNPHSGWKSCWNKVLEVASKTATFFIFWSLVQMELESKADINGCAMFWGSVAAWRLPSFAPSCCTLGSSCLSPLSVLRVWSVS